jgi:hypothetical protein
MSSIVQIAENPVDARTQASQRGSGTTNAGIRHASMTVNVFAEAKAGRNRIPAAGEKGDSSPGLYNSKPTRPILGA